MTNPTVPDGPDTELTAANDALSYLDAYARSRDHAHSGDARRWVEAVRAVLARPAAGQPPANDERECVAVPRSTLLDWRRALLRAVDRTVNPTASALAFAAGEVGYWGQQPAAPADDTAAPTARRHVAHEPVTYLHDRAWTPLPGTDVELYHSGSCPCSRERVWVRHRLAEQPVRDSQGRES